MKDKTISGATLEGGPVFRRNYKAEMQRAQNTFSHYAQVFICFWPLKSKVCVIFYALQPSWAFAMISLVEFNPGACYMMRDSKAKKNKKKQKTGTIGKKKTKWEGRGAPGFQPHLGRRAGWCGLLLTCCPYIACGWLVFTTEYSPCLHALQWYSTGALHSHTFPDILKILHGEC